jgi:hypothetical protein
MSAQWLTQNAPRGGAAGQPLGNMS